MLPIEKLENLRARYSEIEEMLCQPNVLADSRRITALSRERAGLQEIVQAYGQYAATERKLAEDREALADPELREMVSDEIPALEARLGEIHQRILLLLLPKDPNDDRNTILEIRSGTGGEEAALFAGDLFRMYSRYAETLGWRVEIMSTSQAASGGLKEVIALITGDRVYAKLKFEGGVHRVQRIPVTEAQGRIHTSTATVAVLPEADEVDVQINESDLEINIAASGGPGGQGVNTTNSAVQIQHKPSGIIVKCQDERSQIKNKAKALKILRARLLDREQAAQANAISEERRGMVGSGERAEKIRTYNYPQNRVTDHRIGLMLHNLDQVINGDLNDLITPLRLHEQAELLAAQSSR